MSDQRASKRADVFIGVEIGGSKLQLVKGHGGGAITTRVRRSVNPEAGGEGIRRLITEALPDLVGADAINAVGAGFGGPVDWRTGRVQCSHHLEGWDDFPLGEWLEERSGVRAYVDNDANVAALAEATIGAGRTFNPVFYVTLGSGVGGGLVVDQRIYHGATPGEAEIGHLRINQAGEILESRCSGWSVDRRVRDMVTAAPDGLLARTVGDSPAGGDARHLAAAIERGDKGALALLEEVATDLGFGISHVIHLFHPEAVVIGGGLSLLGPPLRDAVGEALQRFVMHAFAPGPKVRLAELGEAAVPAGALILAAQRSRGS